MNVFIILLTVCIASAIIAISGTVLWIKLSESEGGEKTKLYTTTIFTIFISLFLLIVTLFAIIIDKESDKYVLVDSQTTYEYTELYSFDSGQGIEGNFKIFLGSGRGEVKTVYHFSSWVKEGESFIIQSWQFEEIDIRVKPELERARYVVETVWETRITRFGNKVKVRLENKYFEFKVGPDFEYDFSVK